MAGQRWGALLAAAKKPDLHDRLCELKLTSLKHHHRVPILMRHVLRQRSGLRSALDCVATIALLDGGLTRQLLGSRIVEAHAYNIIAISYQNNIEQVLVGTRRWVLANPDRRSSG